MGPKVFEQFGQKVFQEVLGRKMLHLLLLMHLPARRLKIGDHTIPARS